VCLFSLLSNLGAQTKSITEAQYNGILDGADKKVEKLLRRIVTETTRYKSNKVDSIENAIEESFPNGDLRWNSVTKRNDQVIEKSQGVTFGKYEYRKEGEADWVKRCIADCSKAEAGQSFGLAGATELPKVVEIFTSDTDPSGQKVQFFLFYRVYQVGLVLQFYEKKLWINSEGLIQRQESITSEAFPTNKTSKEIITYEYNPKDVAPIEPPIK